MSADARTYIELLGGFVRGCAVILKHGANLLPQFRRVRVTVDRAGMQHR